MNDWTIAILPLVGVVLGAVMQFLLSRTAERKKHADALRSHAYSDYLRAVAAMAHPRSDEDRRNAVRDLTDAKARIAIYGDSEVVKALARFEEAGAVIKDGPSTQAFFAALSSMRTHHSAVSSRDLRILLLGAARESDAPDQDLGSA